MNCTNNTDVIAPAEHFLQWLDNLGKPAPYLAFVSIESECPNYTVKKCIQSSLNELFKAEHQKRLSSVRTGIILSKVLAGINDVIENELK